MVGKNLEFCVKGRNHNKKPLREIVGILSTTVCDNFSWYDQ